jgi:hypothetical protein
VCAIINYVIYLSSEIRRDDSSNSYGFWDGKTYSRNGLKFPSCSHKITDDTKVYKNKTRAEAMCKKLTERCWYVNSYFIEEY